MRVNGLGLVGLGRGDIEVRLKSCQVKFSSILLNNKNNNPIGS